MKTDTHSYESKAELEKLQKDLREDIFLFSKRGQRLATIESAIYGLMLVPALSTFLFLTGLSFESMDTNTTILLMFSSVFLVALIGNAVHASFLLKKYFKPTRAEVQTYLEKAISSNYKHVANLKSKIEEAENKRKKLNESLITLSDAVV